MDTCPKGSPSTSRALRRCAARTCAYKRPRSSSGEVAISTVRSVVSGIRRGICSSLRIATDISFVRFSTSTVLLHPATIPTIAASSNTESRFHRLPLGLLGSQTAHSRISRRRTLSIPASRRVIRRSCAIFTSLALVALPNWASATIVNAGLRASADAHRDGLNVVVYRLPTRSEGGHVCPSSTPTGPAPDSQRASAPAPHHACPSPSPASSPSRVTNSGAARSAGRRRAASHRSPPSP